MKNTCLAMYREGHGFNSQVTKQIKTKPAMVIQRLKETECDPTVAMQRNGEIEGGFLDVVLLFTSL